MYVENENLGGLTAQAKIDHCNFIFTRTNLSSNESRPDLQQNTAHKLGEGHIPSQDMIP